MDQAIAAIFSYNVYRFALKEQKHIDIVTRQQINSFLCNFLNSKADILDCKGLDA